MRFLLNWLKKDIVQKSKKNHALKISVFSDNSSVIRDNTIRFL